MAVFSEITGATVILRNGGVYRQVPIYLYKGQVFAKTGSGYIALHREQCGIGQTSVPKTTWESLEGVATVNQTGKTALYYKEPTNG